MPTPQSITLATKLEKIRRDAEERDAKKRAEERDVPYLDIGTIPITLDAVKRISQTSAKGAFAAGLQVKDRTFAVGVYDPILPETKKLLDELKTLGMEVKLHIVSKSALEQIWKMYQFVPAAAEHITGDVHMEKLKLDELMKRFKNFPDFVQEMAAKDVLHVSTTELFQLIIAGALAAGASDIHIEAEEHAARVRFRMDGILHDAIAALPVRNYANIITRIKLLSQLKINVRGEAQDGRFTVKLPTKEMEVRVSLIPSEFGETVVMRLLDPDSISVNLPELGLRADDLKLVEVELSRPNGLILNTGPTGSGKTTTLYAFIRHVTNPEIKIITVEDPIEYRIQGIEQTQVDAEAGYTFASGLRSILRQDPDVILVGEIRDKETADIALQAALTGHIVFSTLHTNDAVGAVPRLVDLGVSASTVGPALSLMIAQRLVRKLCEKCKKAVPLLAEDMARARKLIEGLPARVDKAPYEKILGTADGSQKAAEQPVVYEKVGCAICNNFGYKGRIGIFEFLRSDENFQEAIVRNASSLALKKIAAQQQMISMQKDGILKVLSGQTTFDEVKEATGPLEW
jgi:type IV pilus assembly protein PilB